MRSYCRRASLVDSLANYASDICHPEVRLRLRILQFSRSRLVRYFLRRLAFSFLLFLGVSVVSFAFAAMAPGDYFNTLAIETKISPHSIFLLRSRYGLDQPAVLRYLRWLASVLR